MSAAESEEIDPEEPDDDQDDADEQPEIENEEFADLGEIADDVEAEAGAGADDDLDNQDTGDDDLPAPDDDNAAPSSDGETWGDLYVGTLTTVSNALIEEYGDESKKIDEELARQQHLDEYFNEWMESRGKREDMPPEQALILSTSMFMVTVLGTKTDLFSQLLAEADLDL
jgi:hypothetical protein